MSNWCNFKQSDYVKNFDGSCVEEKIWLYLFQNLQLPGHMQSLPRLVPVDAGCSEDHDPIFF